MSATHLAPPETPGTATVTTPKGRPYTETREFGLATVLAVFAAGALIGAAALILTPHGSTTRRRLGRGIRRLAGRDRTRWDELRSTLDRAVKQRRAARRAARAAAAADDASGT